MATLKIVRRKDPPRFHVFSTLIQTDATSKKIVQGGIDLGDSPCELKISSPR
jgi:hypothetical protein